MVERATHAKDIVVARWLALRRRRCTDRDERSAALYGIRLELQFRRSREVPVCASPYLADRPRACDPRWSLPDRVALAEEKCTVTGRASTLPLRIRRSGIPLRQCIRRVATDLCPSAGT